jgi:hypothetical protein
MNPTAYADRNNSPLSLLQGLGEGPERILAGTDDGYICLHERDGRPLPAVRHPWALGGKRPYGDTAVTCMAATDNVVVAGYNNGAMRLLEVCSPEDPDEDE